MPKKTYGKQTGRPITHALPTPAGGVRLETFVPWMLVKRGYKKQIITPLDAPQEFLAEATREREVRAATQDTALMRALGLAHHWQRLLDEQRAASVAEIAEAEAMDVTQARRVMRLTLGSITVPMAEMKPDRQRMIFSAFSYSPVCAMSASAPIDSPSSPMCVARPRAASTMTDLVCWPFCSARPVPLAGRGIRVTWRDGVGEGMRKNKTNVRAILQYF